MFQHANFFPGRQSENFQLGCNAIQQLKNCGHTVPCVMFHQNDMFIPLRRSAVRCLQVLVLFTTLVIIFRLVLRRFLLTRLFTGVGIILRVSWRLVHVWRTEFTQLFSFTIFLQLKMLNFINLNTTCFSDISSNYFWALSHLAGKRFFFFCLLPLNGRSTKEDNDAYFLAMSRSLSENGDLHKMNLISLDFRLKLHV